MLAQVMEHSSNNEDLDTSLSNRHTIADKILDEQAIKTKIMYEEIQRIYADSEATGGARISGFADDVNIKGISVSNP